MARLSAALVVVLLTAAASGQQPGPPKPVDPPKPAAEAKPADPKSGDTKAGESTPSEGSADERAAGDDDDDGDGGGDEPSGTTKGSDIPPPDADDEAAPEPILPMPAASDQLPAPFVDRNPPGKVRKLEIGPDIGVTARSSAGDNVSYSPGLSYGLHLRVEVLRWLGFRAYFLKADQEVSVEQGALGPCSDSACKAGGSPVAGVNVEQPAITTYLLGARLEPTLHITPRLRAWAGLGIAWGRLDVPEAETNGAANIRSYERNGVMLDYSVALGAGFDVIPDWLMLSTNLSFSLLSDQSGSAFEALQGFDQNGNLVYLDPLPKFSNAFSALLGLGVIL